MKSITWWNYGLHKNQAHFIYTVISSFKYILKQWTVFSRALIGYSTSGYPVLLTVSPPVPPSERRQIRVSYEQNGFPRFSAIPYQRNFTQKSNKLFPKYTNKVMKLGLEVLTGKALSGWLEFIDEAGEKVFCLQMQIKSCVTLFNWQGSKIRLKLDLKNLQLFLKKFPRKSQTNSFKSFVCRQENTTSAGSVIARQNCNRCQQ